MTELSGIKKEIYNFIKQVNICSAPEIAERFRINLTQTWNILESLIKRNLILKTNKMFYKGRSVVVFSTIKDINILQAVVLKTNKTKYGIYMSEEDRMNRESLIADDEVSAII